MTIFRYEDYLSMDALEANASVTLPLIPRDGIAAYEGCFVDDQFRHFEKLTILHMYALTVVHGPVPKGIILHVSSVRSSKSGLLEPCILAMAEPQDLKAMDYLDRISAGLDSWSEAGFEEPSAVIPQGSCTDSPMAVEVVTLRSMLDFAHSRLRLRIEQSSASHAKLSGRPLSRTEELEAQAIQLRLAADRRRLTNLEACAHDSRLARLTGI